MSIRLCRLGIALLLLACLCMTTNAKAQPEPGHGDLIIIGGNFSLNANAIWDRMYNSRIPGKPIGIFGTAGSNPQSTAQGLVDDFVGKYGAGAAIILNVTTTNNQADTQAMADLARTCGGFYFAGGDQRRITQALYRTNGEPTLTLQAVLEVYRAGGCVSGSSAGAAVMAEPMITGGDSAGALRFGYTFTGTQGLTLGRGIGFFPGAQFDQHHLVRGRLGRLIVATEGSGFARGYGVDENTALAISNNAGWADVLGAMGVFVVDVSQQQKGTGGSRWGIRLHYLDVGDRIHMETGEIVSTSNKTAITTRLLPAGAVTATNVWGDTEAWRLVTELVDRDGATLARGTDPIYDVLFRTTDQTRALRGPRHTYDNTRYAYTITDIEIGVFPRGGNFSTPPLGPPTPTPTPTPLPSPTPTADAGDTMMLY